MFDDGSVTINDVQNDFVTICELEKPLKSETASFPEETASCLKSIILEDKGNLVSNPISGQTYHSKHQFRVLTLRTPCSLWLQSFDAEYKTKAF